MFVIASAHPDTLDCWRTALGDRAAAVEVRRTDALSECFSRLRPQLALLDVRLTHVNTVRIVTELLPRVFDLFTQAERLLDRSQGGLGIGLCLVQRLIELHGGTVAAYSVVGQGSET